MPRFKPPAAETAPRPATVFEEVANVIRRVKPEKMIKLHLGDTHSFPPDPALPAALDIEARGGFAQYCETQGMPELKELIVEKLRLKNRMGESHVQITCGAIHALYATFAALTEPGDEVIMLSPHWHMAGPVVAQAGGIPVDTDFYIPLAEDPDIDVNALLEAGLTPRTAAIYLNTPCNPTGLVLKREVLEKIAAFARANELWVVSDEAYENFIFTEDEHVSIATLEGMRDRTVSIFTFSKCLAAAGYRVGYCAAHPELIDRIHHASAQTIYNAPTNNQHLVAQALHRWDEWFPALFDKYRRNRDMVCERFKGKFHPPEGSFYVFFDTSDDGREPLALLEEMVKNGVAAVPGKAFGRGLDRWFRLCYVAVPEETLAQGIERLNQVLER